MDRTTHQGILTRRQWMRRGLAGVGVLALRAAREAAARSVRAAAAARIFTTANLGAKNERGAEVTSIIAIDPETGDQTTILDDCQVRPRVSPDGRTVAFARGEALWTRSVAGGDEPSRVLDLAGESAASPPVWSADGKKIIVSLGRKDKDRGPWLFTTVRVNVDGTDRTELNLPPEDGVHDWSADGNWLLTASSRNAKIGWQLYVMRPDGADQRQLTEGGNPFYPRFAPDGRRLLYSDGTTDARRGIWVVGVDGNDRHRVFVTGKSVASGCWSPDGTRIAVARHEIAVGQGGRLAGRIEVVGIGGEPVNTITLPDGWMGDMPDWR